MANPTLLSVPLCRDAEKNVIPVTDNGTTGKFSEQYGWQGINSLPLSAGGKAVERLDFNGVLALLGGIDYMTQRGYTFEYDNSLPYVVGCIVIDPLDGKTYRCINDVPAGATNPSQDTANWIPYDIADYVGGALRVTAYSVGDTSTLLGIPAGFFLECTTAGITATTAPTVTQPVTAGDTVTDGTVVWTVRKCFPTSGGRLSGRIVAQSMSSAVQLSGGTSWAKGATLELYGQTNSDYPGQFILVASINDYADRVRLIGDSTGSLSWNDNSLSDAAVVDKAIGWQGYRKHADGYIVQWGAKTFYNAGTEHIVFPISFVGTPSVAISSETNSASYASGANATGMTLGSAGAQVVKWIAMGK